MGQMLDLKEELTLMASSCIKGEAVLSRRGIGGLALVGGVVVLAGCDSGSADDGAMSRSSASQAGASVEPTPVEWRPASEVPAVPDLPSRGVRPTSPKGKPLQMYGLTLTVPEGAASQEWTDAYGALETTIWPDGAGTEIPRILVTYADDAGRSLNAEGFAQETLLMSPTRENTYVARTAETWPIGDEEVEAFIISWTHSDGGSAGATPKTVDQVCFYVSDGSAGFWRIIAIAEPGKLAQRTPLWDIVFSAIVAKD